MRFYRAFPADRCEASHISLFRREQGPADMRAHLLEQDLIYVGGGSVISMLGVWRAHGIDAILREAWEAGVVLCGLSAGSLCWFAEAVTGFHGTPQRVEGLGLLPFSNCVHYEPRSGRRLAYHGLLRAGMRSGYAAEDGAGLHFVGTELSRVVASRPAARGYRLDAMGERVVEMRHRHHLPRRPGATPSHCPRRCHGAALTAPVAAVHGRRVDDHRILTLGGHDFTSRPPDRAVSELMLRLATERAGGRPRICILPTASGDTSEQIGRFYAAFGERPCEPSDLSLFRLGRRPMALRDHLLEQDLIYVGGGSLVNLLAVWEAHELGAILSLAWRQGIVLAGQSAGAMCWFEAGITKSSGKPEAGAGLGLLARQPLRPLQQRARAPRRLPRRGRQRHARRLRPRRLRRPALGGHRPPLRGHRPPRRPRLQSLQRRDRRSRVALSPPASSPPPPQPLCART